MIHDKRGVAALMTVIVIVSIILGIGLIVAKLGIDELIFGSTTDTSHQVQQIADACAEESYFRLKRDSGYTGGSLNLGEGSCTTVVSGSGSSRTIDVEAVVDEFTRNFQFSVDLTANPAGTAEGADLTNWEEQ